MNTININKLILKKAIKKLAIKSLRKTYEKIKAGTSNFTNVTLFTSLMFSLFWSYQLWQSKGKYIPKLFPVL